MMSPDGKYLLFAATIPEEWNGWADWWVVPVDGGEPVRTNAAEAFLGKEVENFFSSSMFNEKGCPKAWVQEGRISIGCQAGFADMRKHLS